MFECFRRPVNETLSWKIPLAVEAGEPQANLEMKQDFGFIVRQAYIHRFIV